MKLYGHFSKLYSYNAVWLTKESLQGVLKKDRYFVGVCMIFNLRRSQKSSDFETSTEQQQPQGHTLCMYAVYALNMYVQHCVSR